MKNNTKESLNDIKEQILHNESFGNIITNNIWSSKDYLHRSGYLNPFHVFGEPFVAIFLGINVFLENYSEIKNKSLNKKYNEIIDLYTDSIVDELSNTQTKLKELREELDIVKSILLINKRNNLHNINNTNVDETLNIIESNKQRLVDKISELEIKKINYIDSKQKVLCI